MPVHIRLGQGAAMIVTGGFAAHYSADGVIACGGLLGLAATLLVTAGNGAGRSRSG